KNPSRSPAFTAVSNARTAGSLISSTLNTSSPFIRDACTHHGAVAAYKPIYFYTYANAVSPGGVTAIREQTLSCEPPAIRDQMLDYSCNIVDLRELVPQGLRLIKLDSLIIFLPIEEGRIHRPRGDHVHRNLPISKFLRRSTSEMLQ